MMILRVTNVASYQTNNLLDIIYTQLTTDECRETSTGGQDKVNAEAGKKETYFKILNTHRHLRWMVDTNGFFTRL